MIASENIQNIGCQWPESLVYDIEQENYNFSSLKISYNYLQTFSNCDLVKVAISYEFPNMDGKNIVSF